MIYSKSSVCGRKRGKGMRVAGPATALPTRRSGAGRGSGLLVAYCYHLEAKKESVE
jgi:hypothetical protein